MIRLGLVALVLSLAPSLAAAQAEGTYPATLFCEAGGGRPALRAAVRLEVLSGRSDYAFTTTLGRESGSGTLTGRQLALTGSGKGPGGAWTARYAGTLSGTGGLLVGAQTFGGTRRTCQISVGDGRG